MPRDPAPRFVLNHMVAPQLGLAEFFALTRRLGLDAVEISNDIAGAAILDGTKAAEVRQLAENQGVAILSINALQKFNHWSDELAGEAVGLADYAAECGAAALVLVAANDGSGLGDGERVANATDALGELRPILMSRGLTGLVEYLGFAACSLRKKSEAVAAISAAGGADTFKLTHDTFHHHLAGEAAIFADWTGLVHVSGVDDPALGVAEMRDSHRVLVGPVYRLGTVAQIKALRAVGYGGLLSFEPFAAELRTLADPARAIGNSMAIIRAELAA